MVKNLLLLISTIYGCAVCSYIYARISFFSSCFPYNVVDFTYTVFAIYCYKRIYFCLFNYANPAYGVATICHQVRCLRWGHPSLFHTATSLLIWYKMFCMRDISYRLIWMKFINMLSVYAQSETHRRFKLMNCCGFNIEPFCSDVCGDHRRPQTM